MASLGECLYEASSAQNFDIVTAMVHNIRKKLLKKSTALFLLIINLIACIEAKGRGGKGSGGGTV